MRSFTLVLVALFQVLILAAVPALAAEQRPLATVPTARDVVQMAIDEIIYMRKLQRKEAELLAAAEKERLVVAIEALRRDYAALTDLITFAEDRLGALKVALAVDDDPARPVPNLADYPQLRSIRVLRDQAERLYLGGKRFLAELKKPTGTRVERLAAEE